MRNFGLLVLCAGIFCTAFGQEFRGTLSGRVVDPSGAVVPGVTVSVTNNETNARSTTASAATGEYTIAFLIPGSYALTAERTGFRKYSQPQIQIGTNQRVTQDIMLEVGASTESITVEADATMLVTSTASVGQVITTRQIENLPMNGRTPLVLAQLSFGVVPAADPRFTRPFDNSGPSGFSMGGGQSQSNELLIDGTPDMTRNRRVAYNPPVDAVSEMKVEAFQTDAAYGNTGGGTVNVTTRGGTNDFHGSVYEFNQVSRLKATPIFTQRAGQVKPVTRFNQYGFTAGGPVWIPKVINGRNRVFWFYSYEGIRQSEPEPAFSTIMTTEERRGDFSGLGRLGANYNIFDPATGVLSSGRVVRQPFPGNVIPANRLNPVALKILTHVPEPNQPGVVGVSGYNGTQNYFNNMVRSDVFGGHLGRLDLNPSDRHKLFFNLRFNDRTEDRSDRFSNDVNGNYLGRTNWGFTFDDVYTLSPTLLLNTRAGWTRFIEANTRQSTGFDVLSLGLPAYIAQNSSRLLFPRIDFGQAQDLSDSGGDRVPFDTFQVFTEFIKNVRGHTFKFGADMRRQIESSNSFGDSVGRYEFQTSWTNAGTGQSSAPLGQDYAAFLLGLPTGGGMDVNASRTNQAYYYSFFAQDDWRIRSNFAINLGLRYERETGTVERFNRTIVGFDPGAVNRVTEPARAAYAGAPSDLLPASRFNPAGGMVFATPGHREVYSTSPYAVSPRFGFTWSPVGPKTVLRGGLGLYYNTYGTFGVQQPGFSQRTPIAITDNFLNPAVAPTLSNPFPDGIRRPAGASAGVNTYLGQSFRFTNPNLKQPYFWRWTFNIQRELGRNLVFELGYMGSRASKLAEGDRDLNAVPLEYLSTSPVRDQANIDRLSRVTTNPFAGLLPGTGMNGSTTGTENLLRPWPQFSGNGGVSTNSLNAGRSWFHMLQARFEKRYASGFNFLTNFVYSKLIEEVRRLQPAAPTLEHRIADEDRPLRLVLSGTYDVPFGKGRSLLDRLIGNWQLNAVAILQAGAPLNWEDQNAIYYGGPLNLNSHPTGDQISSPVFDITRFERASNRALDRNVRTFGTRFANMRADSVKNLDMSLIKSVKITEKLALQIRAEVFNATNRSTFNEPERSPTNSNFGRITSVANLPRATQLALRLKW